MKEIYQRKIQSTKIIPVVQEASKPQTLGKYMKFSLYAYPTLSPKHSLFSATGDMTLS